MNQFGDQIDPEGQAGEQHSPAAVVGRPKSRESMRPGTLYLVGTPIGNLGDMSPRAAAILGEADLVVAEDTRRTLRLLNYLGLKKHLESYHEHNKRDKEPLLLQRLQSGTRLALVTDAGMPGISDPGSDLVAACVSLDIPVVVVPGPCAAITALAGSGLMTDRFVFEGFLPVASKLRKLRLAGLVEEPRTAIFYEAPHRIKRTLADLAAIPELADRRLTLGRELTKAYEEYIRSTVEQAAQIYQQKEPRGEFVLILEGLAAWQERTQFNSVSSPAAKDGSLPESGSDKAVLPKAAEDPVIALLRACLRDGKSLKDAVRQCARKTGRGRNEIYPLALALAKDEPSEPGAPSEPDGTFEPGAPSELDETSELGTPSEPGAPSEPDGTSEPGRASETI